MYKTGFRPSSNALIGMEALFLRLLLVSNVHGLGCGRLFSCCYFLWFLLELGSLFFSYPWPAESLVRLFSDRFVMF